MYRVANGEWLRMMQKRKKKESQQTIQRGKRNNENPVVHIDEANGHYSGRRRWGGAG